MFKTLIFALLAFNLTAALASESELKSTLLKRVPQLGQIKQIVKSPVPGLYEVITQDHLFYADEKGNFLIDGAVYDLKSMRNITEERSRKLFAIDFSKLPLENAIKEVIGKGERKLAVFTDPNCGFCKKLEKELLQIDNVTVYHFMYPIFPGSAEKARNVWCSKDRLKAWNDMMHHDILPPVATCNTPLEKNMALGRTLKVNGTPALIFSDGSIIPGYLPAPELEKALTAAASHQ